MSLDATINEAVKTVPECLAAGYVDLNPGMLLGVKTVDSHPQEVLDIVAAATADLVPGPNVVAIEKIFKKVRGVNNDVHYFQEFIVYSENLLHIFLRGAKNNEQVTVFVCRKSANLGMAITKARMAAKSVEDAF